MTNSAAGRVERRERGCDACVARVAMDGYPGLARSRDSVAQCPKGEAQERRVLAFPLLRSWQKLRFLPAETKLMSDKRAGARLVDRRSTRRVPSRDGMAQKAPQATFSNELGPPHLNREAHVDDTR